MADVGRSTATRSRGASCGPRRPSWSAIAPTPAGCARSRRDRSTATSSSPGSTSAATVRMVGHLDAMIARLRSGEPLQYVLGEWGFRRITLAVDRRVLIPRPETELVAEVALGEGVGGRAGAASSPTSEPDRARSGCRSHTSCRSTARWSGSPMPSNDALDVARANIAGLGRAGVNVRVAHGSWFDALPDDLAFDVVVSQSAIRGRRLRRPRADRRRLGAARGAVRRPGRTRRPPADHRRRTDSSAPGGLARARDRFRPGRRGGGTAARRPVSSTWRSARISPASIASRRPRRPVDGASSSALSRSERRPRRGSCPRRG